MDSEADSATTTSYITPDLADTGSEQSKRKNNQSAASTWAHTRAAGQGENPASKYCKYCTEDPYGTHVSTNMRGHLKSKHDITVEVTRSAVETKAIRQLQDLYSRAESSEQTKEIDKLAFKKHLNQDVIDEALVSLIVVRNLAFRIATWPEFHTVCQALNPESIDSITTAHSQIPKKIDQCFQTHKDLLRKRLQSAISSIHLSLDVSDLWI